MTIAITWWGHASATIELAGLRVAVDPLFSRRLAHLRRHGPPPGPRAAEADVILISHLHGDHLHLPSLRRFDPDVPIVVPRGAGGLLRDLPHPFISVEPGDDLLLPMGARLHVVPAQHDGRRHPGSRYSAPALGYRMSVSDTASFWYPGDTGLHRHMFDIESVDLAVVPIGGWGPSLGDEHLNPSQAVDAIARVGARHAVPVHYGTFWPWGMTIARSAHRRFFVRPGYVFAEHMARRLPDVDARVPGPGERIEWPT